MECPENPQCLFGESHRYDAVESKDYYKSSAIGRMADYRQRMVDYILEKDLYRDYSHMLVLDLDLGVSISPLGILHSLGTMPNSPVASSGRQVWPGSSGTLIPPYDFSAYRAHPSKRNSRLLHLHNLFCELQPPGDRWRNQCDAVSSMHFMVILGDDFRNESPYRVASAFNGATMYPIPLVKASGARYDAGDDAQRCEHIGFNLSLDAPFYVNPKWDRECELLRISTALCLLLPLPYLFLCRTSPPWFYSCTLLLYLSCTSSIPYGSKLLLELPVAAILIAPWRRRVSRIRIG